MFAVSVGESHGVGDVWRFLARVWGCDGPVGQSQWGTRGTRGTETKKPACRGGF